MDYMTATERLGNRKRRKIANNTYLERRDDNVIAIRLHATDILTLTPEAVEYSTGGWFTVTTKARFNDYGPVRVWSKEGRWYIGFPSGEAAPYFDGIRVSYGGEVLNLTITAEQDAEATAEAKRLKRRISAYAKLCADTLSEGMPQPGNGDCWFCLFRDDKGVSWGDMGDHEHLLSHMEEGYVVPSLLAAAVTEAGYASPGFILCATDDGRMGGPFAFSEGVRNAVRKYLKRRLLLAETGAKPVR